MSRGGQGPRGPAFTAGTPAVQVPPLQGRFGPDPCGFCSSWLSEPRGQIKWLSLWLSVSREPGLGQADGGFPEPPSGALHPLLLQPCPPCPLTQDTEGRTRSQQGPVGAPGPPCLPGWTGPGTARRTAEWLALLLQAVWPLPVGHRPPGPALPVPAQPPLSPGLGEVLFIPTSQMKTPRPQRGRDVPQPRVLPGSEPRPACVKAPARSAAQGESPGLTHTFPASVTRFHTRGPSARCPGARSQPVHDPCPMAPAPDPRGRGICQREGAAAGAGCVAGDSRLQEALL